MKSTAQVWKVGWCSTCRYWHSSDARLKDWPVLSPRGSESFLCMYDETTLSFHLKVCPRAAGVIQFYVYSCLLPWNQNDLLKRLRASKRNATHDLCPENGLWRGLYRALEQWMPMEGALLIFRVYFMTATIGKTYACEVICCGTWHVWCLLQVLFLCFRFAGFAWIRVRFLRSNYSLSMGLTSLVALLGEWSKYVHLVWMHWSGAFTMLLLQSLRLGALLQVFTMDSFAQDLCAFFPTSKQTISWRSRFQCLRPDGTQGEWGEVASDMLGFVGCMVSYGFFVEGCLEYWIPSDLLSNRVEWTFMSSMPSLVAQ